MTSARRPKKKFVSLNTSFCPVVIKRLNNLIFLFTFSKHVMEKTFPGKYEIGVEHHNLPMPIFLHIINWSHWVITLN